MGLRNWDYLIEAEIWDCQDEVEIMKRVENLNCSDGARTPDCKVGAEIWDQPAEVLEPPKRSNDLGLLGQGWDHRLPGRG